MNKRYKQKWIDALRSKKYKQTTGTLQDTEGFCCLGVLCDTSEKARKHYFKKEILDSWGGSRYDSLDSDFLAMFGLSEEEQDTLTDMNDREGKSFKEIAKYIEKNL